MVLAEKLNTNSKRKLEKPWYLKSADRYKFQLYNCYSNESPYDLYVMIKLKRYYLAKTNNPFLSKQLDFQSNNQVNEPLSTLSMVKSTVPLNLFLGSIVN